MTCGDLATNLTAGTGGDAGQAPRHRNQSWPSGSRHTAQIDADLGAEQEWPTEKAGMPALGVQPTAAGTAA